MGLQKGAPPAYDSLLAEAQEAAAADDLALAAMKLQAALTLAPPYNFFTRAQKLIAQARPHLPNTLRKSRVAVLGSSTTSLLVPVFQALCLRDRIDAEFYEGLYGAIQQEVLDPQSGLAKFEPEVVYLAVHWRDLDLPPATADPAGAVEAAFERYQTLWQALRERFRCHVVQHGFDYPPYEAYGTLGGVLPGGRTQVIESINRAFRERKPSYVSILDTAEVQRRVGAERWWDPMMWHSFQQHPSTLALPELADAQAAHLRAVLGLTRKVLVTDLDNTLWKGIIGEDGLDGIKVGAGSPAGEAHAELQRYMLDLRTRGVLLAVCSKNNFEDARLPFERHRGMALSFDDFASFKANWSDKASNLREMADELALKLDSFVFIDDSPFERDWVRKELPDVAVIEPGASVFQYIRALERGRYFEALTLSAEDSKRADQYRVEAQRRTLKSSAASLEEYLEQLELRASVEPVADKNLARVTQLTNKTNQFNLTTRRYTEAQVQALAGDDGGWTGVFRLEDRMGDYGVIGVILCRPAEERRWEVDTWLMSCRALGRQMEQFMLDKLVEAAREQGIEELIGVFRPTAKNKLVEDLFPRLGFEELAATPEETRYRLGVPAEPLRTAVHIVDRSAQGEAVPVS